MTMYRPVAAPALAMAMTLTATAQATTPGGQGVVGVPGLIGCSQTALVDAIQIANGVDTGIIELPDNCTIELDGTANAGVPYDEFGPVGLPPISGRVILVGHGGTIRRSPAAPPFRLLSIVSGARLDLVDVRLEGGYAKGGRGGNANDIVAQMGGGGGGGGLGGDGGAGNPAGGGGGGSSGDGGDSAFGAGGGGIGGSGSADGGAAGQDGSASSGGLGRNGGGGGGAFRGAGGAGGPGGGGGGAGSAGGWHNASAGGAGGFGGGGGGAGGIGYGIPSAAGVPGFGGGWGGAGNTLGVNSSGGGGGGGAGLGGAVLQASGSELCADAQVVFSGNVAEGGRGGDSIDGSSGGGGGGSGYGASVFSMGHTWFVEDFVAVGNSVIGGAGGNGTPAGAQGSTGSELLDLQGPVAMQSIVDPTATTATDTTVAYDPDAQQATTSIAVQAQSGVVDVGKVVIVVYADDGTPVAPGYEHAINGGGGDITFQVPAGLPIGDYALHVTYVAPFGAGYSASVDTTHMLHVVAGPATTFSVSGFPSLAQAGVEYSFDVTAYDAFGHVATGYIGLVHFTSSDPIATLPADASLVDGSGSFEARLHTLGTQSIHALDAITGTIVGQQDGIVVAAADARMQIGTPYPIVGAGAVVQYDATVSNTGAFPSQAVLVNIAVPPDLASPAWACTASGGATCSQQGSGDVHDVVALPINASVTYTVTGLAPTDHDDVLTLSGTAAPKDQPDQQPGNNASDASVFVGLFFDGFEQR